MKPAAIAAHQEMIKILGQENPTEIWVDLITCEVWKRDRQVDENTGEVTEGYFVYRFGEWVAAEPSFSGLTFDPRTGYPIDRGERGEGNKAWKALDN